MSDNMSVSDVVDVVPPVPPAQEPPEDAIAPPASGRSSANLPPDAEGGSTQSPVASTEDSANPLSACVESLDKRLKTLTKVFENELPSIHHDDGDTLVYIDPAPQQPELDNDMYEHYYTKRYAQPSRMHSSSFRKLGSPYFETVFRSTQQHRVLRRRRLVNKLPRGVKYVIDLSPPSEGDDAVWLATQLSCSDSIRRWYRGRDRWRISPTLIGVPEEWMPYIDTEEARLERRRYYLEVAECCDYIHDKNERLDRILSSDVALPPALSPIRHRSAIKRILLAIDGQDPQLNSAPALWTTAALAEYFNISGRPCDPVVDYVIRWLRASPNTFFVEVLPEETLRIAENFRNEALCRESFAILVGEQALEVQYCSRDGNHKSLVSKTRTIFGRNKGDIHEEWETRIGYARAALTERVRALSTRLLEVEWVDNLLQFQALKDLNSKRLKVLADKVINLIKTWIRGWLYRRLCSELSCEKASNFDEYLFPVNGYQRTWNRLLPSERTFCQAFWMMIARGPLDGNANLSGSDLGLSELWHWRENKICRDLVKNGVVKRITRSDVFEAVLDFNGQSEIEACFEEPYVSRAKILDLAAIFEQAKEYINNVSDQMLGSPPSDGVFEVEITNTLVYLKDTETKYLPLWAGGNDDGSGGVFDDEVPIAEHGFTGAGPSIHTAISSASSTGSFTEVGGSSMGSHHTSTAVHDGFSDTLDRRQVYAASGSMDDVDDDDLWRAIRESNRTAGSEAGFTESGTLESGTLIQDVDYTSQGDLEDAHTRVASANIRNLEIAENAEQTTPAEAKGKGRGTSPLDDDDILELDEVDIDDGSDNEIDMVDGDGEDTQEAGDSDDDLVMV